MDLAAHHPANSLRARPALSFWLRNRGWLPTLRARPRRKTPPSGLGRALAAPSLSCFIIFLSQALRSCPPLSCWPPLRIFPLSAGNFVWSSVAQSLLKVWPPNVLPPALTLLSEASHPVSTSNSLNIWRFCWHFELNFSEQKSPSLLKLFFFQFPFILRWSQWFWSFRLQT